jgi:RNA polymerase sigma-70 factor (ECF subfamily)
MSEAVKQLESLYEAHGPALLAYLKRLAGGREMAEDLLHETFTCALRRPEQMAEVVTPRAWLFAIARNTAISSLRKRRDIPEPLRDVAERTEAEDPRFDDMRRAIAELPDELREAIELRLRQELTYEEIAAVLSIPVGTVRSRLHRAVQQLRDAMRKDEANDGT